MTPEDAINAHLDTIDDAADWRPVVMEDDRPGDIDRAWTMAAHLCKMHRYHLAAYLGWGTAYGRGLCTEVELGRYLTRYEQADALGISWRGYFNDNAIGRARLGKRE